MTSRDEMTEQAVEAVMVDGRRVRHLPDVVRARMIARARAHIQAAGPALAPTPAIAPALTWGRRRWALAAAALLAFSAAGAAAGFYARGLRSPDVGRVPPSLPAPAAVVVPPARVPVSGVRAEPASTPERPRHLLSPQESYTAELSLLQRAHSAYNTRAFRNALALLGEHARRFPNGRLAEEREALRIRSFEAAGRADEARRALTAFGKRFPRSALLPRLSQPSPAEP